MLIDAIEKLAGAGSWISQLIGYKEHLYFPEPTCGKGGIKWSGCRKNEPELKHLMNEWMKGQIEKEGAATDDLQTHV